MPTSVMRITNHLIRQGFVIIYNSFYKPDTLYGSVILKRKDVSYTILKMITGITVLYQDDYDPIRVLAQGRLFFSDEELQQLSLAMPIG